MPLYNLDLVIETGGALITFDGTPYYTNTTLSVNQYDVVSINCAPAGGYVFNRWYSGTNIIFDQSAYTNVNAVAMVGVGPYSLTASFSPLPTPTPTPTPSMTPTPTPTPTPTLVPPELPKVIGVSPRITAISQSEIALSSGNIKGKWNMTWILRDENGKAIKNGEISHGAVRVGGRTGYSISAELYSNEARRSSSINYRF